MTRRLLVALGLVLAVVGLGGPAGADPARPTNYRSEVTGITPRTPVIEAAVVGGDGFLDLRVDEGHEVVVDGYDAEPYLRFRADGTVQENQSSPAAFLNRSRYADTEPPAALQGDELPAPRWKTVASGGRYAWHDHRIHFMGSDPSAVKGLADGEEVEWSGGVPLRVDGKAVVIHGHYRLLDAPSPLPWLAVVVLGTVAIVLLGRRAPVREAGWALLGGAVIATYVGWQQNAAIPDGAGATPLTVILPAVAVVAAAGAVLRSKTPAGVIAALAAAATLGGWVLTRYTVFSKAVLPTELSANADRAGTAIALATAIGGAILAVRSGGLALPRLEVAEEGPAPTATPRA